MILNSLKVFLFDLDGCIYYGNELAPGAKEILHMLRAAGKQIGFITNNSRQTAAEILVKMNQFGLEVHQYEIFTATDCTGHYIQQHYGFCKIKVAGSQSLSGSLERIGHQVLPITSYTKADLIVIAKDTDFTYSKLNALVQDALQGTPIIGTNPDRYHPGEKGNRTPETGSLIAALEGVIDRKVVEYVGKPAPYLFQQCMELYGAKPDECVMIGDNLETDIAGGNLAGMTTVWMRGEGMEKASSEAIIADKKADFTVSNLMELLQMLEDLKVV
jgi:4-nitrophenyl phosphatase